MKNNTSLVYNFCLVIGDAMAIIAAFIVAYILRVSLSHAVLSAQVHAHDYVIALVSLLPFWILIFALLGLYNSRYYDNRFSEFGRLLIGSFIGILFVISYSYVANVTIFPARLVTAYGFGLAFCFSLLFRTLARAIRRELFVFNIGINNVLIVGDTPTTNRLIESMANFRITGLKVAGVVGGKKHVLPANFMGTSFADFTAAVAALKSTQLHTIVQTELYAAGEQNDEVLTYAQQNHIAYRFVPGNSELFTGNIELDLFHTVPVIAVHQTALIGWGRIVKRLTDITIGSLLLIVASPLMLVVTVIMKLTDHGPILFRQERLTRFNTSVRIFKFRSHKVAYNGLSPEAAFIKMKRPELIKQYRAHADFIANDPRISRIGHFMRRTKIDELPQLLNVIKGDISLVGPRALVAYELDTFAQKNLILSVKSGLTGLAQISGVEDLSFEERRKLDLYYVQNWSFGRDIVILLKTIVVVINHRGTR